MEGPGLLRARDNELREAPCEGWRRGDEKRESREAPCEKRRDGWGCGRRADGDYGGILEGSECEGTRGSSSDSDRDTCMAAMECLSEPCARAEELREASCAEWHGGDKKGLNEDHAPQLVGGLEGLDPLALARRVMPNSLPRAWGPADSDDLARQSDSSDKVLEAAGSVESAGVAGERDEQARPREGDGKARQRRRASQCEVAQDPAPASAAGQKKRRPAPTMGSFACWVPSCKRCAAALAALPLSPDKGTGVGQPGRPQWRRQPCHRGGACGARGRRGSGRPELGHWGAWGAGWHGLRAGGAAAVGSPTCEQSDSGSGDGQEGPEQCMETL